MQTNMWLPAILLFASAALGGCVERGRSASGARHVAQSTSTMSDARSSAGGEPHAAVIGFAPACTDVPERDQASSPLENRRVVAVTPIREPFPLKGRPPRLLGATVYILASPGLTKEWLGHLIECHVARVPPDAQSPDPLTVGHATVDVISTSNGFAVSMTSKDPDDAKHILSDSELLGAKGST